MLWDFDQSIKQNMLRDVKDVTAEIVLAAAILSAENFIATASFIDTANLWVFI